MQIGIRARTAQVQKIVLIGTARMLRKFLKSKAADWLDFKSNFQYSFTVCQLNNNGSKGYTIKPETLEHGTQVQQLNTGGKLKH